MISDVIVLYVLKKRKYYRENKYQEVLDADMKENEYEIINNPPDQDPESQPLSVAIGLKNLSPTVSLNQGTHGAWFSLCQSTTEPGHTWGLV